MFAIVLLALVFRFDYLNGYAQSPFFDHPDLDEGYHDTLAQQIAAGNWLLDKDAYHRAPLYYYLLGSWYAVFGHSPWTARIIQSIGGAVLCLGVYFLGARLFGWQAGMAGAVLLAINPVELYFENSLLLEAIVSWWNVPAAFLLSRIRHTKRLAPAAGAGFLLGLSAITRPNILVFFPVAAGWTYLQTVGARSRRVVAAVVLVVASMIPVGVVTLRNVVHAHDFVLISWQGGRELFIGNNAQANGYSAILPGARNTILTIPDTVTMAEEALGRKLAMSEVDTYFRKKAFAWMFSNPAAAAALLLKKAYLWVCGYETPNIRSIYYFRRYSTLMKATLWRGPFLPWGLLLPLAVMGCVYGLAERSKRWDIGLLIAFVATYALTTILFFVGDKFRVPTIPFLSILGGAGIVWFLKTPRVVPVVAALAVMVVANTDAYGFRKTSNYEEVFDEALALQKGGQDQAAIEMYRKALEISPSYAPALSNLGTIYFMNGQDEEAEKAFREAASLDPTYPDPLFNNAILLFTKGQYREGLTLVEKAAAFAPGDPRIHYARGWGLLGTGDRERARYELELYLYSEKDDSKHGHARELLQKLK